MEGLYAFEFKYRNTKARAPGQWVNAYPDSEFHVVTTDNFLEFLI